VEDKTDGSNAALSMEELCVVLANGDVVLSGLPHKRAKASGQGMWRA